MPFPLGRLGCVYLYVPPSHAWHLPLHNIFWVDASSLLKYLFPSFFFPDASSSVFSPFKPLWMQIIIPPWFLVTLTFAKSAFSHSAPGRGKILQLSLSRLFNFRYYKFKMLKRVKAGTLRPIVCYRRIYYQWQQRKDSLSSFESLLHAFQSNLIMHRLLSDNFSDVARLLIESLLKYSPTDTRSCGLTTTVAEG